MRTGAFIVLSVLLVAAGIGIGASLSKSKQQQVVLMSKPIASPQITVKTVPTTPTSTANVTKISPINSMQTPDQDLEAIKAYSSVARTCTDNISGALNDLSKLSQNAPGPDSSEAQQDIWIHQNAISLSVINGMADAAAKITNVPPACYESHRVLVGIAREAVTFNYAYVAAAPKLARGIPVPDLNEQGQQLRVDLARFDASLPVR